MNPDTRLHVKVNLQNHLDAKSQIKKGKKNSSKFRFGITGKQGKQSHEHKKTDAGKTYASIETQLLPMKYQQEKQKDQGD